jgi:hypothetical protein
MAGLLGEAAVGCRHGSIYDLRVARRRAFFHARHPWRGALLDTAFFLPFLIWIGMRQGWFVLPTLLTLAVLACVDALSWGPEGERRRRFIRKYGALPEWREARWMSEGSRWPY